MSLITSMVTILLASGADIWCLVSRASASRLEAQPRVRKLGLASGGSAVSNTNFALKGNLNARASALKTIARNGRMRPNAPPPWVGSGCTAAPVFRAVLRILHGAQCERLARRGAPSARALRVCKSSQVKVHTLPAPPATDPRVRLSDAIAGRRGLGIPKALKASCSHVGDSQQRQREAVGIPGQAVRLIGHKN
jgi:hypothetical protein